MKIGILTFHRVWNAGAFLQAVALYDLLESEGHDVAFLDYIPKSHQPKLLSNLPIRPKAILPRIKKNWISKKLAGIYSNQLSDFKVMRPIKGGDDISGSGLDLVVTSADVWNYGTKWSRDERVFFGDKIKGPKLMGYSVSLGNTDPDEQKIPEELKQAFSAYDLVFPRDETTGQFASELGLPVKEMALDAGFFLDSEKYKGVKSIEGRYIAIYALPNTLGENMIAEIKDYALKNNLKIIAPAYVQAWADISLSIISPLEWFSVIYYADCVVTNTFHGTVFSILLRKRFSTYLGHQIRMKTKDMITLLEAEKNVYQEDGDLKANLSGIHISKEKLDRHFDSSKQALIDGVNSLARDHNENTPHQQAR
ncbi:MAG: hypothetical protein GVY36_10725 [Verrucomicrobia bacterium]|jgi:hypothetical protein|nr:hypothetical protein [Verrucomicrobiota bacterium]